MSDPFPHAIAGRIRDHASSPVLRLLLFGSRATGTAHERSNYDLLVVEQDPVEDWWAEEQALRQAVADLNLPVDIHVTGETEYLETRGVPGSLAYPAEQTGVVLYERSRAGEDRPGQPVDRVGAAGPSPGRTGSRG